MRNQVLKEIRDGTVVKDVSNKAFSLSCQKSDTEKRFLQNGGYGIAIENEDNTLILNGKNTRTALTPKESVRTHFWMSAMTAAALTWSLKIS